MLPAKLMVGRVLPRSLQAQLSLIRTLSSLPRYPIQSHSIALIRDSISKGPPISYISQRDYSKARRPRSEKDPVAQSTADSGAPPPFDPRTLLDQGIPPTPDQYNTTLPHRPDATSEKPSRDSLRLAQAPVGSGGGGGGGGSHEYVSSTDRKRERLAAYLFVTFILSGIGGTIFLGRNWETQEELDAHPDVPNGWGVILFYNRISARLNEVLDYYNLPNGEILLPDHTTETYRPYTLVISLEDNLVHSSWTREHGWRMAKRPGVEYFLTYLSQYYEIVIFTSQPNTMAGPVVAKIDPFHTCHQLYREATKYKRGKYIKDLRYLNRPLSKIIMIDTKEDAWTDQPENAIKMKPWKGDPNDKELVALIPFLEFIAAMGHEDVREDLKTFPEGSHIPTEFARRDAIARAELKKQLEGEKKGRRKSGGGDFLASLLGMKPKDTKEEKLPQDIVRERGQQWYDEISRNLKEHGEEYLEMDRKLQEELMAGMKTSLSKIFTEGMPTPPMPPQPGDQPPEQRK